MSSVAPIVDALTTFVTHARPDLTHLAMRMISRAVHAGDPAIFLAEELNRMDGALLRATGRPLQVLLGSLPLFNVLRRFVDFRVASRMLLLASVANNGALVEDRLAIVAKYRLAAVRA